jgi:hypothetical protein
LPYWRSIAACSSTAGRVNATENQENKNERPPNSRLGSNVPGLIGPPQSRSSLTKSEAGESLDRARVFESVGPGYSSDPQSSDGHGRQNACPSSNPCCTAISPWPSWLEAAPNVSTSRHFLAIPMPLPLLLSLPSLLGSYVPTPLICSHVLRIGVVAYSRGIGGSTW